MGTHAHPHHPARQVLPTSTMSPPAALRDVPPPPLTINTDHASTGAVVQLPLETGMSARTDSRVAPPIPQFVISPLDGSHPSCHRWRQKLAHMVSNTMSALLGSRDVVPIPLSATPRIQTPRRSPQ